MKLINAIVAAAVGVLGACAPSVRGSFAPGTSAIVDTAVINRAACRLPRYVEGSWTPPEAVVAPLEAALTDYLVPALARDADFYGITPYYEPSDYYRRYAGVTYGGRELVAICGEAREIYDSRNMDWRTQTIPYRDGGAISFGAHYDPETQQIVYFEFGFVG